MKNHYKRLQLNQIYPVYELRLNIFVLRAVPDKRSAGPVAFQERGAPSKITSQHLLNHKVCGQGIRVSSFTLCMLYPVRIVTWQSECIFLTASVARWL